MAATRPVTSKASKGAFHHRQVCIPVAPALRVKGGTSRLSPIAARAEFLDAILFDCDGVLVDTERDGHRLAFNEAFRRKGLPHAWDVDLYGELLEIGGGKERMTKYFKDHPNTEPFRSIKDSEKQQALIKELHLLKTDIFMQLVETGAMPLRPGVARLINEAIDAGVKVAVCSTSNERAVSTIVRVMLGPRVAENMPVFAGDMVPKKKPDPAIYLMGAKELKVRPDRCVVVEDSRIGLQAAKAAGMRCIVTKSSYTQEENFQQADLILDSLGEDSNPDHVTVATAQRLLMTAV